MLKIAREATLRARLGFFPVYRVNMSSVKIDFSGPLHDRLIEIRSHYANIGEKLSSPDLQPKELTRLSKEYSALSRTVELIDEREELVSTMADLKTMEQEERSKGSEEALEMADMAKLEHEDLVQRVGDVEGKLVAALTPRDDADDRGVVVEVRAGTGGDEASLFASEIFKMYQKFAGLRGWRWDEISYNKSEIGGFKEAQASVTGEEVFKLLKFESGTHRVQRVPVNDVKIQTSAASVVVMPEAEEVDV